MQPVIEIAAKLAFINHLFEIAVSRGNKANIHPDGPVASEALEFLLLDGAQQLGLQL